MATANPIFEDFKRLFSEDKPFKITSQYMLNRILSMHSSTFMLSVNLNKHVGRIDDELFFTICKRYINGNSAPYVKFIGRSSKKEEIVNRISQTFNCNSIHASQIIKIFDKLGTKPEVFYGMKPVKR